MGVDKVVGSARSATFENGKLVFAVGISKRKYAQDLMTLIDEGHLHNAFSIGWRSGVYTPDTKTYTDGEILVAPEGFVSSLMLEKDNDGRYVFAPSSNFSQLLTAKIFEFDFMTDSSMDLISFNDGKYLFPNGRDMLRSAFDNDYNQDILLHEKPVAGSLFGRKVCARYFTIPPPLLAILKTLNLGLRFYPNKGFGYFYCIFWYFIENILPKRVLVSEFFSRKKLTLS